MESKTPVNNLTINVSDIDRMISDLKESKYSVSQIANEPTNYLVLLKKSTKPLRIKPVGNIYREKNEITFDSTDPDCIGVLWVAKKYAK